VATLLRLLVRLYQVVFRPILPPMCRFSPTCSDYALEALATHGALKGGALAAGRICRCHPWNAGGFDPVPPREPPPSLENP
jgi:uncharacterized protein